MAIQQHPLPQDISSYRFRLIGDMTIKQFASLGISIIIALVSYSLPLPFFFKYPISFIFVVLGVGMAFVPVQGRSLDVWIIAFIKSIYSPTLFSWKKTPAEDINTDTMAPTEPSHSMTPAVSSASISIQTGRPAENNENTEELKSTSVPTPAPQIISPQQSTLPPTKEVPEVNPTPSNTVSLPTPPKENLPPSQEIKTETPTSEQNPVTNLPIPFTPTTPNTLVGLTISKDNRILDGVLVEIKKNGVTSRATKSNKLGQFMFARPLENGVYQILAEKEGFSFSTYSLELVGDIIRPLKIQSQS